MVKHLPFLQSLLIKQIGYDFFFSFSLPSPTWNQLQTCWYRQSCLYLLFISIIISSLSILNTFVVGQVEYIFLGKIKLLMKLHLFRIVLQTHSHSTKNMRLQKHKRVNVTQTASFLRNCINLYWFLLSDSYFVVFSF